MSTRKGSRGLRTLLEWIRTLPLSRTEREAMYVYAEHANYWDGSGSSPSPRTVARQVRVTERRAQQILRKLLADPECETCNGTGSARDAAGSVSRCLCHKKELGYLVVDQPVPPISWRLNVQLPIIAAAAKKSGPSAAPSPGARCETEGADATPASSEKSEVSTTSTNTRNPEAKSGAADGEILGQPGEIFEGSERNLEPDRRNLDTRNKERPSLTVVLPSLTDDDRNPPPPPSVNFPAELRTGLLEIHSLDEKAIAHIWTACRENAPDCTVDEVLHAAWTKANGARNIRNLTGFLVATVPIFFYGESFNAWREEQRYRAARQAADKLELERQEAESRRRVEEYQREEEAIKEALAFLDTLPAGEFNAMHLQVEKCEWVPECRRKMPSGVLEQMIRREMAKRILLHKPAHRDGGEPGDQAIGKAGA